MSGSPIVLVTTPNAPAAGGHYSQGVVYNGVIYVAGQLPIDPTTTDRTVGSIEQQTRQALGNIAAILVAAGSGMERVLSMTIYISDIALWGQVNAVYAEIMGAHRPARAIVPTHALHFGYQIEIQAIAAVDPR